MEQYPSVQSTDSLEEPIRYVKGVVVDSEYLEELPPLPVRKNFRYREDLAQGITDRYMEGEKLKDICKEEGYPNLSTVMRWMKDRPDFRKLIEAARVVRAFILEENALEGALHPDPDGKDQASVGRLRFDAYAKLAEWNNPAKYGKKVTHEGNPDRPMVFNIVTGFQPPNEHQQPPELGPDGLIIKKVKETIDVTETQGNLAATEATSIVLEADGQAGGSEGDEPRESDNPRDELPVPEVRGDI